MKTKLESIATWIRQAFCRHKFRLGELSLTGIPELDKPAPNASYAEWQKYFGSLDSHPSHTRRIQWPCAKCGKVFYEHCGLDVSPKHGGILQESLKPQAIGIAALIIIVAGLCADGATRPPLPHVAKPIPHKSPRAAGEMVNAPMLGATSLTPSQRIVSVSIPKTRAVNLAWDASSDVVGYNVFSGGSSRSYTNSLAVGNVVAASVPNLLKGSTYYFAVTAFDAFGYESQFSSEVSYTVPFYDLFGVSVTFLKSDKSTGPWTAVTTFPEITVANTNLTEFYSSKMDIWVKP